MLIVSDWILISSSCLLPRLPHHFKRQSVHLKFANEHSNVFFIIRVSCITQKPETCEVLRKSFGGHGGITWPGDKIHWISPEPESHLAELKWTSHLRLSPFSAPACVSMATPLVYISSNLSMRRQSTQSSLWSASSCFEFISMLTESQHNGWAS